MTLHPQVLKKNGRKEFVVLSYEEFQAMRERIEDLEDLAVLREAIRKDDPSVPGVSLEEIKAELGLIHKRPRQARPPISKRGKKVTRPA